MNTEEDEWGTNRCGKCPSLGTKKERLHGRKGVYVIDYGI